MNLMNKPPMGQKHRNTVSTVARRSARGQECTLRLGCCNHDTATTSLCHLRFFGWAGMAQKPHDFLAVYACSDCHDALDRRNGETSGLWGYEDILRALGATQIQMHRDGVLMMKGEQQ